MHFKSYLSGNFPKRPVLTRGGNWNCLLKSSVLFIGLIFAQGMLPAQTINPSVTPELILPFGSFPEVENTGAFLAKTEGGFDLGAVCWDGANPGIAVVERASTPQAFHHPLPSDAHDPDIVYGIGGSDGVVVYELNGTIVAQHFQYSSGNITLDPMVPIFDGTHPNIDKPYDCGGYREEVVITLQTPSNQILYVEGDIFGSFGSPQGVPNNAGPSSAGQPDYVERIRPDVAFLGKVNPGEYAFTYVGLDPNGNWWVDTDLIGSNYTILKNIQRKPVIPEPDLHPRIDGVLGEDYGQSLTYFYTVVYEELNEIWRATNSVAFTNEYSSGNNALPVVAYSADDADAIWTTDALYGSNTLLGRHFSGSTPDTYLKEMTDPFAPPENNLYPSLAGHCSDGSGTLKRAGPTPSSSISYLAFWYEANQQELVYKWAQSNGTQNYKRGISGTNNVNIIPEYINRQSFRMPSFQENRNISIFSSAGQLIQKSDLLHFNQDIAGLEKGIYLLSIEGKNKPSVQKLVLQ